MFIWLPGFPTYMSSISKVVAMEVVDEYLALMREEKLLTSLGAAIRKRRTALKVSQEAFADLIGMHRAYYSAIERGERNLTLGTLHRVAKGLGVRMADLMRDCNI